MSYIEELNARVMLELTQILLYCHTCEFQVLELLKVANCMFNKDEFFEVVDSYTSFKSNMEILESILSQVDVPITMLQIITVKSMINELKGSFDVLIGILEEADKRIDNDEIDFGVAGALNKMLNKVEFDVVDFDVFKEVLGARYFVTYLMKDHDAQYDARYGDLNVLVAQSFNTKCAAYTFALKNGISKDMVWSMYEQLIKQDFGKFPKNANYYLNKSTVD